jgi:plasmid maintenance system antidote protein VapI
MNVKSLGPHRDPMSCATRLSKQPCRSIERTPAQLWMDLQNRYDVEVAKRAIGKKLDKIEPILAHAAA